MGTKLWASAAVRRQQIEQECGENRSLPPGSRAVARRTLALDFAFRLRVVGFQHVQGGVQRWHSWR